ncbi:hypothetical protein F4782DRAFT_552780 [Xylaria castorea]|nr:hypothetical protein F4782DRAFT_552780 [Xylaria castorea]
MGARTATGLPFSAKKMSRQAPTVRKICQQALVNETGDTLDFMKALKLMNEKHMPNEIVAFVRQNRVEGWNERTYGPWEDVETNTVDIINHPFAGDSEPGSAQVDRSSTDDSAAALQPVAGTWQTVAEETKQDDDSDDDSDAISDTSFTPPKHLVKRVQYDNEGRRRVLPPTGCGNVAPKQKQRFVCDDGKGRKHLMPPPGFHGALPKLIVEPYREPPITLTFERRKDFKKGFEKRQVTPGGISLRAMRKQSSQSEGNENKCSFEVPTSHLSVPKKEQPASPEKPAESPLIDRLTEGWESAFLKGVFEVEEDLLYSGRWPVATF